MSGERVLQLDGDGSHVRLPRDAFDHLEAATVEAWVKWQRVSRNTQPFGFGRTWQMMGLHNGARGRDLVFFIYEEAQKLHAITVPDALEIDAWYHIAAVTGPTGMKLYLNGVLAGEDDFPGSFAAVGNGEINSLGQSYWPENASFFGQLADVRIWSAERTGEQILQTMHQPPAAGDDALVGCWDFSEADARDVSGGGLDGELVGTARCVTGAPPTAEATARPTILRGQVVDTADHPVPQAAVRLEPLRGPRRIAQTDAAGRYQLVVWEPSDEPFDLSASYSELGVWCEGLRLEPGASQRSDLVLEEVVCIEGTLLALDSTPHANVVVQALRRGTNEQAAVVATTQCDRGGKYRFVNLRPGEYDLRCHVGGGYSHRPGLQVEPGRTLGAVDFRFAPFRRGVWPSITTVDGLPSNSVWSLARGEDGTQWVGTIGSVSKFDGASFTQIDFGGRLTEFRIRTMHPSSTGALWFSTEHEGVWRIDGDTITNLTTDDGLPHNEVRDICETPDGDLFFGTAGGLCRYDGHTCTSFTTRDGLVDNWIWALHADDDGTVWIGTNAGLSRFDGRRFERYTTRDGLVDNRVTDLTRHVDGGLWIGTQAGASRFDGQRFTSFTTEDGLADDLVRVVSCDRRGIVWLGTRSGISRFDGQTFTSLTPDERLMNVVQSIEEDAEGVLWVGTQAGISRFDERRLLAFTSRDGLADSVQCLEGDADGAVWFGTDDGVDRYFEGAFRRFTSREGLVSHRIFALLDTPEGLLCGTASGACRFDGERFVVDERITGNYIFCLFRDSDGALWAGTTAGATRYDGSGALTLTTEQGLGDDNVEAVGQDAEGLLWIGTRNGLSSFDGTSVRTFTTADGLPHNRVLAIEADGDGRLWIGTEGGVARWDGGAFVSYTTADGLGHINAQAMACSTDGLLWVGGLGGVVSCFDGTAWATLDSRDGLRGGDIRSIVEGADGTVWFGTDRGATSYRRGTNAVPVARIVSVQTDTRITDFDHLQPLTVGIRTTIEYTCTDYRTLPEKRQYRCRVNEAEWSRPTRSTRFEWTPQEEGSHLFEVQAIDQDLNYSQPVGLQLQVAPEPQSEALRRTRRELEEAYRSLAAQNEQLETQSRALQEARDVAEDAREAAEAANRAKSIFLANMSHEIRTPMNAMLGYTQILLRDDDLSAAHRRSLETVEQSGQHLLSLIDEVLDISRIEAGRQDIQETDFDLAGLVRDLGAMFELRCTQKGLGWRLEDDVAEADLGVRGDEGKLRQVLSNLLSNAVKFTAEGEVVLAVLREGSETRFEVRDTGPGLDSQEQQRIFEPFQRGQVASAQQGAGLGLAIAKRLVELMGGQLAVDSAPRRGSRFFFALSLEPSVSPVGARVAASRVSRLKSGYAVQALIADDLEENRRVLAELLQSIGCQVAVAEGGAEAVEACGVSRPDIVFMDIRMPGMDGREAAQRIWRTHGPMPIVAVSASALIHERQRYLQDGFAGFVAKPLQFDRICQCLVDLLQVEFDDADHPAPEPPWSRVALPASLLAALREAAGQGEVTRLRATLHEVEPLGEAQRQLAEHLLALSRDLDLNAIRSILDALDDE